MKKKLLYLASIVLFSATSINAQTTVWDFGNGTSSVNNGTPTAAWAISTGIGITEKVIDHLGLFPIATNTNFGAINASNVTIEEYTGANRFQTNGGGFASGADNFAPTQRYLYFNVDAASTVTIWFKTGSNGAKRTGFVSNGSAVIGSGTANDGVNADVVKFTATLPAAGKYYIYGDTAINLYKIEVTGANVTTPALATDNFQAESNVAVYASQGAINVSNVTSATKVNVYSVLGSLVKSTEISADASLSINSGFYIVKAESAEGVKTVKVLVK